VQGGQTQRTFSGSGANEDIVVASARAYISALNKLIAFVSASQRAAEASADEQHDHEQHAAVAA
jgi:2-isopropylmalate synthase